MYEGVTAVEVSVDRCVRLCVCVCVYERGGGGALGALGAVAVSSPVRIETSFDVVDFVFKALDRDSDSFACVLNISAHVPPDTVRSLQKSRDDL